MSLSKNEIKLVKSLQIKKFRELHQLFVVEGIKLVQELLIQNSFRVKTIYFTEAGLIQELPGIDYVGVTAKELERISSFKNPNKVLAVVEIPSEKNIGYDQNNLILVLDTVNDPGNLAFKPLSLQRKLLTFIIQKLFKLLWALFTASILFDII
jgi:TrmH family RNA methyltransferase